MQPLSKAVLAVLPVSKTAGHTASGTVDCRGFSFASIDVVGSAAGDTTAPTVLKIEQSHDKTTYVTAGLTGGTDFDIPAGNTSGSVILKANINLQGKRRYLRITVVPGTTTILAAVVNLFKGGNNPAPIGTTGSNAEVVMHV